MMGHSQLEDVQIINRLLHMKFKHVERPRCSVSWLVSQFITSCRTPDNEDQQQRAGLDLSGSIAIFLLFYNIFNDLS